MKQKSVILQSILASCLLLLGLLPPIVSADSGTNYIEEPTIETDGLELYESSANSHTANVDLKTTVPATVDIQVVGKGSVRHGDQAYHGSGRVQTTHMRFQIVPDDGQVLEKVVWNGCDVTKRVSGGFLQFSDLEDGVIVAIFKEKKVKELPCPKECDCRCGCDCGCCNKKEPPKCCKAPGGCCKAPCCGNGKPCKKCVCDEEKCEFKGPTIPTADYRDELMLYASTVLAICLGLFVLTYIKKSKKLSYKRF